MSTLQLQRPITTSDRGSVEPSATPYRWSPAAVGWGLLTLFGVALLVGHPAPKSNEWTYLALMKQHWNPAWIVGDWALAMPDSRHLVFNTLCGWPTLFLPVEVVAWIGRVVCWIGIITLLFRIGSAFDVRPRATAVALLVWVGMGQSLVGGEWMLGGFEAKTVSYLFLLAAIDGFLRGRTLLPATLLGGAFSLHVAVGLWSGLAIGGALLLTGTPIRRLLVMLAVVIPFALPGAIPLLAGLGHDAPAELRFQAVVRFPYHMDPFFFDRGALLAGLCMVAFNVVAIRAAGVDRNRRALVAFQLIATAILGLGIVARATGHWSLLVAMPFRLFPLFVPLIFAWIIAHGIDRGAFRRIHTATALLGLLALVCTPNPVIAGLGRAKAAAIAWRRPESDTERVLRWVATHTPPETVVVTAPIPGIAHLVVERPLVAAWACAPHGHLADWRERIEALRGDDWTHRPGIPWTEDVQRRFDARSAAQLLSIRAAYGGDVVVGRTRYPSLPLLHREGDFYVHDLSAPL